MFGYRKFFEDFKRFGKEKIISSLQITSQSLTLEIKSCVTTFIILSLYMYSPCTWMYLSPDVLTLSLYALTLSLYLCTHPVPRCTPLVPICTVKARNSGHDP